MILRSAMAVAALARSKSAMSAKATFISRLLKNYTEPPLRSESAVRKAARKGVSSERLSPSELTPRKRFLAQPVGQHGFEPGAALELSGKAFQALHRQLCLARGSNPVLRWPA